MKRQHVTLKGAKPQCYECSYNAVICGASSEFVSSSIPSWQILTAHAQPFRGARDLVFCLRFLLTHCLYERAAEVLARLRGCAGSPEPSLLAYAIRTKFAWRGPYNCRSRPEVIKWIHRILSMTIRNVWIGNVPWFYVSVNTQVSQTYSYISQEVRQHNYENREGFISIRGHMDPYNGDPGMEIFPFQINIRGRSSKNEQITTWLFQCVAL